jgi:hypothetical protein
MKQRSPIYEEALPAVDEALALAPGIFKNPAHKKQRGFYLVLTPPVVLFSIDNRVRAVSVAIQLYDPTQG